MMATGTRSLVAAAALVGAMGLGSAPLVAQEAPSIFGMAWTPEPAPAVVVSASGPLSYSETREGAGVLVLDLAGASLAAPIAAVSEPGEGLAQATLEEGGDGVTLRLEMVDGYAATVASLPAGLEVRVAAAAATAAHASQLDELVAVAENGGVSVLLAGDGPLEGKTFTLPDPNRVVLDLPGVVNRVSQRVHPVEGGGVLRVRVSQNRVEPEPMVRVVVDLEDGKMPYRFETTPMGAVLRVGEPRAAVAMAREETPAEQPVTVAEADVPAPVADEPAAVAEPAEIAAADEPEADSWSDAAETAEIPPIRIAEEPFEESSSVTVTADASLTAPPVDTPAETAATADSPWTTSPAAMVEEATPEIRAGATTEIASEERRFTGEPISLTLKDADIRDVLRSFATITGLNIVVDPEVKGSVTVDLNNVPWDQVLDIILRINGLDYVVENNVLRVSTLAKLRKEKADLAAYKLDQEKAQPLKTVTKTLSYAKAQEILQVLQSKFLLSPQGEIIPEPRTNTLVIRDIADRLPAILNLIETLDTPVPQVIIEARIVETTRTFSRQLGVAWGFTGLGDTEHGTTTGWTFPNSYSAGGAVNLGTAGQNGVIALTFSDILDAFNLDFTLNAAESDGLVKIVSSPKVVAQNNQVAHIQSGIMVPIQTVANNTVTVQYINATLSLDVTPQITVEGTVILDINLMKREPLQGINLQEARNVPISTRDAQTRLMVRDGGTTVIGGIYQFNDQDQQNMVPGLHKIPILGALFRNKDASSRHDELLIFITPRIVKY